MLAFFNAYDFMAVLESQIFSLDWVENIVALLNKVFGFLTLTFLFYEVLVSLGTLESTLKTSILSILLSIEPKLLQLRFWATCFVIVAAFAVAT